ncbi:unnamed protein product [Lampetra planeri]
MFSLCQREAPSPTTDNRGGGGGSATRPADPAMGAVGPRDNIHTWQRIPTTSRGPASTESRPCPGHDHGPPTRSPVE